MGLLAGPRVAQIQRKQVRASFEETNAVWRPTARRRRPVAASGYAFGLTSAALTAGSEKTSNRGGQPLAR